MCNSAQLNENAKVGKSVIPGDPNTTSENGKLLLNLIEREKPIFTEYFPTMQRIDNQTEKYNIK